MADLVLDIHSQLSKSLVVALRLEDRIVAEALPSPTLSDNLAIDDSFELMDFFYRRTATGTYILFLY